MYAIYTHTSQATKENIVSDIVTLLTGETNVESVNFSAGMERGGTKIYTDYETAGWEAIALDDQLIPNEIPTTPYYFDTDVTDDGVTPITVQAYGQIVRAKAFDADVLNDIDPVYKYALIWASDYSTTPQNIARVFGVYVYEQWQDVDRIGLNSPRFFDPLNPTQTLPFVKYTNVRDLSSFPASNIHISASSNHALFNIHLSDVDGRSEMFGIVERTRDSAWDIKSNKFPPFGYMAEGGFVHCRTLDAKNNRTVVGGEYAFEALFDDYTSHIRRTVDQNRNIIYQLIPIIGVNRWHQGGTFSPLIHCYWVNYAQGGALDEIIVDNVVYVIWQSGIFSQVPDTLDNLFANYKFAIRKG